LRAAKPPKNTLTAAEQRKPPGDDCRKSGVAARLVGRVCPPIRAKTSPPPITRDRHRRCTSCGKGFAAGANNSAAMRIRLINTADTTRSSTEFDWQSLCSRRHVGCCVVQLAEGPHHIEVTSAGYRTYSGDIQVRDGQTGPLNVSLMPERP